MMRLLCVGGFQRNAIVVAGAMVILAAIGAWMTVMSTLAPYDDEGYVMMTLHSFFAGAPLYTETHTQYGPAFYLLSWMLHQDLGLPLTHDAIRCKTVVIWLLSSGLVFSILNRLRVHTLLAMVLSLMAFLQLDKLALEPGHPQEWTLLLTLIAFRIAIGDSPWKYPCAAVVAGFVGMIKINCGLILALPLLWHAWIESSGSCSMIPSSRVQKQVVRWLVTVVLLFPLGIVMAARWTQDGSGIVPFVVAAVGLWMLCWRVFPHQASTERIPKEAIRFQPWVQVVFFGALSALGLIAWCLAMKTSLDDLVWGLVGQHRQFTHTFFHPMAWSSLSLLGMAIAWGLVVGYPTRNPMGVGIMLSGIGIVSGVLVLVSAGTPLLHGLQPRGAAMLWIFVGPSLVPLLVDPSRKKLFDSSTQLANRAMLGSLVCLGAVLAFPTPGTQVAIGTLPCWILLGVLLQDAMNAAARAPTWEGVRSRWAAAATMMVLLVLAIHTSNRWVHNTPLQLEGAKFLRLEASLAEKELAIARAIQETACERLVFDGHSHNRFYFWTHTRPLTAANPTFWPRMLTAREQQRWMEQLDRTDQCCIVVPTESNRLAADHMPELRQSLRQHWSQQSSTHGWLIAKRIQDE